MAAVVAGDERAIRHAGLGLQALILQAPRDGIFIICAETEMIGTHTHKRKSPTSTHCQHCHCWTHKGRSLCSDARGRAMVRMIEQHRVATHATLFKHSNRLGSTSGRCARGHAPDWVGRAIGLGRHAMNLATFKGSESDGEDDTLI